MNLFTKGKVEPDEIKKTLKDKTMSVIDQSFFVFQSALLPEKHLP